MGRDQEHRPPSVKAFWRWLKRGLIAVVLLILGLGAPVAYVETACRPTGEPVPYQAILVPEHHRPESRTLLTYPEWDIVHAYDDYGRVLATGDPHDFQFLKSISGFWSALCALSEASGTHGQIDADTKQMVYVIGVSFTAEFLMKAAYEETIGRLFVILRGAARAPLDDLSAQQAEGYANFLQQVPWYKWDFESDRAALAASATNALRDRERNIALGLEYAAKAAYAGVIAQAVAQVGPDALTLRMIVRSPEAGSFEGFEGVTVIAHGNGATEIETIRYRALTHLMTKMAQSEVDFVEIAGNDEIMMTVLSRDATHPDAIYSRARQGADDYRHLIVTPVSRLAETLRELEASDTIVEHIHDY